MRNMVIKASQVKESLQLMIVLILFCLRILLQPSAAVTMRAAFHRLFARYSPQEVENLIQHIIEHLDEDINPGDSYYPGVVKMVAFQLSDGRVVLINLIVLDELICNLGRGDEYRHEPNPVLGTDLLETLWDDLMPNIERLIRNLMGYGVVTENGITIQYSVFDLPVVGQPSDNVPDHHKHEDLFEVDAPAIHKWSEFADSSANNSSPGETSISPFKASSNLTLRQPQNVHAGVSTTSNSTHGTLGAIFQRKFPVTSDGDCDVASLALFTSAGPYYDETNVHGAQMLNPTDKIWSPNARFYLVMQLDCNLVLYDIKTQQALWSTKTNGKGSTCFAKISIAGELLVFDGIESQVLWRSNTWCTGNNGDCWTSTILQVQDDGNTVLYIIDANFLYAIWDSDTVVCKGGCE